MDDTAADIRGILALLRRQFRLILISFVVVVTLAGIYTFSLTPIYSSTALVLVDTTRKNLLDPEAQSAYTGADSARIDSEVEILRSDNILVKVIDQLDLAADANLGVSLSLRERILALLRISEPTPPTKNDVLNQALNNLRNSVSIQRRGLTYLISITARSRTPEQAATVANAVAKAYIDDQLASKISSTLASRDVLQSRIAQARDAITSSEGSFDNFIQSNIERIGQGTGGEGVASIQRQIQQLSTARDAQTRVATEVEASLQNNDFATVVASLQSTALEELQRQRDDLTARLSGDTTGSASTVDLQTELASIEDRLRVAATDEVATLRQTIAATQEEEASLRQDLRQTVLNSALPADILTQLFELQQNAELARSQYQLLLSRAQDLEAQADLQLADSRLVSSALPPQTPSSPNRVQNMLIAAVVALGLGVALAFLYENFIGGFTSEAQLASVLKVKVAGAIPRQKAKSEKDSLANLMLSSPLSVFAESVRRLRAALQQSMRLRKIENAAIVMVTSSAPNEGKTTVALALARSYALSGHRTVLIDCDLRKPSLHRHLGIEPSQGLLEFLGDQNPNDFGQIVSKDVLSDATVIVGARRSDLPTDQLLTSKAFARLIDAAKRTFDIVIIDTPPIGPVVDGLFIAPFADAIVFVTRWSTTSQTDARQAVAALMDNKAEHAEILAVINQQDETRSSHMRRYGDYYAESA